MLKYRGLAICSGARNECLKRSRGGEEVKFFVHSLSDKRNGEIKLYGFLENSDLKAFQLLLSLPEIGASRAIGILERISGEEFLNGFKKGKKELLTAVGVPKKSLLGLKAGQEEKVDILVGVVEEAVGALVNLGFSDTTTVKRVVTELWVQNKELNVRELVTKALKEGHEKLRK